jgi:hypothetical protein
MQEEGAYLVLADRTFLLGDYMKPDTSRDVRCHDQAGALSVLARLLGCDLSLFVWDGFGYINDVLLVGVPDLSNSPYWERNDSHPSMQYGWSSEQLIVDFFFNNDILYRNRDSLGDYRTYFSRHLMAILEPDFLVYDPTSGPSIGEGLLDYATNVIDYLPHDQLCFDYGGEEFCALTSDGFLRTAPERVEVSHVR